ncbi:MAG: exopolysaccharide Pel transporter PelG, partial [Desulfatiglandaceae bacterium]
FRTNDLYEGPVFFAYITIVPTLALFLLKIETVFYEHYRSYYGKIIGKWDMAGILREKDLMIRALKESLREVLIIQGAVTLLCLFFAPELVKMAKMTPLQVPVFRIALIGSFLQVLLALNIIILFYFDLRRTVLAVTTVFLVSNAGLSYVTTRLGIQFYGYGFTYACLVSLLFSFYLLNSKVRDLEYITFAGQPVL